MSLQQGKAFIITNKAARLALCLSEEDKKSVIGEDISQDDDPVDRHQLVRIACPLRLLLLWHSHYHFSGP
jgi:hypothetical protein